MPSANKTKITDEIIALPIARIDSQDEEYVVPLREFLESNGCEVVTNPSTHISPRYRLICGDFFYVKHFFSERVEKGEKRLYIVWNSDSDQRVSHEGHEIKTAYVDPRPLTSDDIKRIFTFFFTVRGKLLDIRKDHPSGPDRPSTTRDVRRETPAEETNTQRANVHYQQKRDPTPGDGEDRHRIAEMIADVFGNRGELRTASRRKVSLWSRRLWSWQQGIALIVLLTFAFPGWYVANIFLGGIGMWYAGLAIGDGKLGRATTSLRVAEVGVRQAASVFPLFAPVVRRIGADASVADQEQLLSLLGVGVQALRSGIRSIELSRVVAKEFFDTATSASGVIAHVGQLRSELTVVQNDLALAQAHIQNLEGRSNGPFAAEWVKRAEARALAAVERARTGVTYANNLLTLYPRLGGFTATQTYLLLLQNSMELRPTGGFIGSIGVATVADGKLVDLKIEDVYTVDGQLKGHVDPPDPIRDLLGQEHWYLRDSNWDPDFRVSGEQAAWFYEKETGTKVDGVIGISVPVLVRLLEATGPLTISDYNDRISAENFFGKSLLYTQVDFFPGSTQKKDFLGSVTNGLLTKITSDRGAESAKLAQALATSLAAHDILFSFPDPELESLVVRFGWAGAVVKEENLCALSSVDQPCLPDFLYLVGANMGINKLNYFIKQRGVHTVSIRDDGTMAHEVTLEIANTSGDQTTRPAAPTPTGVHIPSLVAGTYRTYLQVLVPADAQIRGVLIDGQTVSFRGKTVLTLPYVTAQTGSGVLLLGVVLDVPQKSTRRVSISYTRAGSLSFGKRGGSYELYIQKQPGVSGTEWTTTLRYPMLWSALRSGSESLLPTGKSSLANEATLEYNTTLSSDARIRVAFVKP